MLFGFLADGSVHIIGIVVAISAAALVLKVVVSISAAAAFESLYGSGCGNSGKTRNAHTNGKSLKKIFIHRIKPPFIHFLTCFVFLIIAQFSDKIKSYLCKEYFFRKSVNNTYRI